MGQAHINNGGVCFSVCVCVCVCVCVHPYSVKALVEEAEVH